MQTEMTNTHKSNRQDMREESADKLHSGECHQFLFAMVAVIEILESDSIFPNRNNAMIGNGNAEDIATEIFEQYLDAIEGSLDVNFPIFGEGFHQHVLNIQSAIVGIQFALSPELGEFKTKAVTELIGKEFDGKEELVRSGIPTIARGSGHKGAAGDDEM